MNKLRALSNAPTGRKRKPVREERAGSKSHSTSAQHSPADCEPNSQGTPIFDEDLLGMLIDSLGPVQAAVVSASERVPYTALRPFIAASEEEKRGLIQATQSVVAKHAGFFSAHKDAVEVAAVLTAVTAMKLDFLFSVVDQCDGSRPTAHSAASSGHVCSPREALWIALVVLAPVGILAIALLFEHFRRK